MSELAATYSTRSPVVLGIRRAEAMALTALALAAIVSLGPSGFPFSLALLAAASVLLPRRRAASLSTKEEQRLQLMRDLLQSGKALQMRYEELSGSRDSHRESRALLQLRFQVIDWIADSRSRIARYPEFAGIYEAHHGANLFEELHGRLHRLEEIERLAQTSRRLDLPV